VLSSCMDKKCPQILTVQFSQLPIVQEHVTALKEHREFEKEFEINTKYAGEKNLGRTKVPPPLLHSGNFKEHF
jgi:hypothetical protein